MPVVACPKCKTKFKLSTEQLGKAVRCNSCQAKFRTAAPKAAGEGQSAKPKGKAKSKSKSAPSKPAKKTPKTLEDELFASAPLKPGAPDPLGNFVLEDPGFGELELPAPEDDGGRDSDDNMFADRAHLMNNPALKGRKAQASPSAAVAADKAKADKTAKKKRLMIIFGVVGLIVLVLVAVAIYYFAFTGSETAE